MPKTHAIQKIKKTQKFCKKLLTKYLFQCILTKSVGKTTGQWGLSSAGRASALQAEGHRFEPYRPHFFFKSCWQYRFGIYADVAQLAEQLICNQQVIGSSPIIGSVVYNTIWMDSRVAKGDRL